MLLVACTDTRSARTAATLDARPDARPDAAPVVSSRPAAPIASAEEPSGPCADAIIDARRRKDTGWKVDPDPFDANGDGTEECVLRGCHGANCDVMIYVREGDRARFVGEVTASFVSSPRCVEPPRKGTFCRLEVGVYMIHGETQQMFHRYDGSKYVEDGYGKLSPGPPKGVSP